MLTRHRTPSILWLSINLSNIILQESAAWRGV